MEQIINDGDDPCAGRSGGGTLTFAWQIAAFPINEAVCSRDECSLSPTARGIVGRGALPVLLLMILLFAPHVVGTPRFFPSFAETVRDRL